MNILLCCLGGMSTSIMVKKIKEALVKDGYDGEVWAIAVAELENHIEKADIVLLGPQIRYKVDGVNKIAEKYNKPVKIIDMMDYGTMNGAKVYSEIKGLVK